MNPRPAKFSPFKAWEAFNLVTFTIGAAVSHVINVALQLQDAQGHNLAIPAHVEVYLSDNADGSTLTATVPTSTTTIGTDGKILVVEVTDKVFDLLVSAAGKVELNFTQTATQNYYLVVKMPDGSLVVSPVIAFP